MSEIDPKPHIPRNAYLSKPLGSILEQFQKKNGSFFTVKNDKVHLAGFDSFTSLPQKTVNNLWKEFSRGLRIHGWNKGSFKPHFHPSQRMKNDSLKVLGHAITKDFRKSRDLRVSFANCHHITNHGLQNFLVEMMAKMKMLRSFDISFSGYSQIDKAGIQYVGKFLRQLNHLRELSLGFPNFAQNKTFPESVLVLIAKNRLPWVEKLTLNFQNCRQISDDQFKQLGKDIFTQFPLLQELKLIISHSSIEGEALELFDFGRLKNLKKLSLDFSNCAQVSDKGVHHLAQAIAHHAGTLRELSLEFPNCKRVTDTGLKDLTFLALKHLIKLRLLYLNFHSCDKITDKGTKALATEGLKYFEKLRSLTLCLTGCNQITDETLNALNLSITTNLQKLQYFRFFYLNCPKPTSICYKSFKEGIVNGLPDLKHFELNTDNISTSRPETENSPPK